jgi:hypothetical protein
MSTADPGPGSAVQPSVPQAGTTHKFMHIGFWVRELPFSLVLILTMVGVAYTTFSKQPITGYWEILAPLIALVCVGSGWPNATDYTARFRLIATQALHWFAFLVVMNMLLLSSVQRVFSASATGIAIFTLLAIAWVENSALILLLLAGVVFGIAVVLWWHFREWRTRAA